MSGGVLAEAAFPLYERARSAGAFQGRSLLIVAPTATGKSRIGRDAILAARRRDPRGPLQHVYLVPFVALANELYEQLAELPELRDARVRVAAGDRRDSPKPEEADVLVATYEAYDALLRAGTRPPGTVVADEVHLIADPARGPRVEALLARLIVSHSARQILALSAVVDNGPEIAAWLGIPLLEGTAADRPVGLETDVRVVGDPVESLADILKPCQGGEQALVFCSSRARADRVARELADAVRDWLGPAERERLHDLAEELAPFNDREARHLAETFPAGVAFHHRGLTRDLRALVERAFRQRLLRVVTCTPTLAAGVNLPCGLTVVLDATRTEYVRGRPVPTPLSSGDVLNMLGRAGRPGQVGRGLGILVLSERDAKDPSLQALAADVKKGSGGRVTSRLPESFEAMMRFVLVTVAERGETTWNELEDAFELTFARHLDRSPFGGHRPLEVDLMEDIPSYRRVAAAKGSIRLLEAELTAAGVRFRVLSGSKPYEAELTLLDTRCDCVAATRYRRGEVCKHAACGIHTVLFERRVEDEVYWRTLYLCGRIFQRTLDLGTRLRQAVRILEAWGLLERSGLGWTATPLGRLASTQIRDLLLVRQAVERVRRAAATGQAATYREVALWSVEDFFEASKERENWARALPQWLDGADVEEIRPMPVKFRGDFEQSLEDLAGLCRLYAEAARALGREVLAAEASRAAGVVRYGVPPEVVPLAALGFTQLGRARCRALAQGGIRDVRDLARASPPHVAGLARVGRLVAAAWIERARQIADAQAEVEAGRAEAATALDELLSRFRVDASSLAP